MSPKIAKAIGPKHFFKSIFLVLILCASAFAASVAAAAKEDPISIAVDDLPGVDQLNLLAAVHRARARGVPIEISYLQSEDIAAQAIVGGLADIGVGTPYATIQKTGSPIRMFCQLSKLRFFPVVNVEFYRTWKDLNGATVFVHSPGSGTEAIMKLMAKRAGIRFADVKYLPGSAVRANALLAGRIKATIVDSKRRRLVVEKGGGRFAELPTPEINATDEALFAKVEFLKKRGRAVSILLEEIVNVWRTINKNPSAIVEFRRQFDLLPELPSQDSKDIARYYEEGVNNGIFPNNGGIDSVNSDLEFYSVAGTIAGDAKNLKIEDFWNFELLGRTLGNLGRI